LKLRCYIRQFTTDFRFYLRVHLPLGETEILATAPIRLLIAASGTGGHLFPAIALAQQLQDYKIEWLGVPDRLERELVPAQYPLHTIPVEGFQQRFGLGTLRILGRLASSVHQVRQLLKTQGNLMASSPLAVTLLGLRLLRHGGRACQSFYMNPMQFPAK
jgi:UDP-N-acetylglucosamine--N-acetylmuramyl-(pentapeptide) pyrophosphoryl-undecaprenol N-acetylglucosamine transferase